MYVRLANLDLDLSRDVVIPLLMGSVPIVQEYQDSDSKWNFIWQLSNFGIREDRNIPFVFSQIRIFDFDIGFLEFPENLAVSQTLSVGALAAIDSTNSS